MKKYLLSTFLILSFACYALFIHFRVSNVLYDSSRSNGANPVAIVQSVKTAASPSVKVTKKTAPTTSRTENPPSVVPSLPSTPVSAPTTVPIAEVQSQGQYKDGQYIGSVADAYYGNIQVKAIVQSGKLIDVQFLDYPQDRSTSVRINSRAMPALTSEAVQVQGANVDTISGATDTSSAFRESLTYALQQAAT